MGREAYPQRRPAWCPHPDCEFVVVKCLHGMCGGKLPEPVPHDDDFNTHRICLRGAGENDQPFDLQINRTDAWWFRELLDALFPRTATEIVTLGMGKPTTAKEREEDLAQATGLKSMPNLCVAAGLPEGGMALLGIEDRGWRQAVIGHDSWSDLHTGWFRGGGDEAIEWEEGEEHPRDREASE